MHVGRIATELPSLFQASGVGYNGFGYVTIEGDILSPNTNLSVTNVIEVSCDYLFISLFMSEIILKILPTDWLWESVELSYFLTTVTVTGICGKS